MSPKVNQNDIFFSFICLFTLMQVLEIQPHKLDLIHQCVLFLSILDACQLTARGMYFSSPTSIVAELFPNPKSSEFARICLQVPVLEILGPQKYQYHLVCDKCAGWDTVPKVHLLWACHTIGNIVNMPSILTFLFLQFGRTSRAICLLFIHASYPSVTLQSKCSM